MQNLKMTKPLINVSKSLKEGTAERESIPPAQHMRGDAFKVLSVLSSC